MATRHWKVLSLAPSSTHNTAVISRYAVPRLVFQKIDLCPQFLSMSYPALLLCLSHYWPTLHSSHPGVCLHSFAFQSSHLLASSLAISIIAAVTSLICDLLPSVAGEYVFGLVYLLLTSTLALKTIKRSLFMIAMPVCCNMITQV
jgi:hypothetical protein